MHLVSMYRPHREWTSGSKLKTSAEIALSATLRRAAMVTSIAEHGMKWTVVLLLAATRGIE
jgi:hypothetical protein